MKKKKNGGNNIMKYQVGIFKIVPMTPEDVKAYCCPFFLDIHVINTWRDFDNTPFTMFEYVERA